jgi:beta-glucosidase
MKKIIIAFLSMAILTGPASALVTGKVVNGKGTPVADAMIYYTSIANRLVYVYSHTDGFFCIPSPTEWNVNDPPMYKSCATQVRLFPQTQTSLSSFFAHQKGSQLVFRARKENTRIRADVYSPSGKHVARVMDKLVSTGTYAFYPFNGCKGLVSRQMYIVRLSDGAITESVCMIHSGKEQAGNALHTTGTTSPGSVTRLAKAEAVDGLRVGKTGFKPSIVNLNTYADNVGNVIIDSIPIEHMVDSIINKPMTIDEKVGQLVQAQNGAYVTSNFVGSTLKGSSYAAQQGYQNSAMSTRLKIPLTIGTDFVHGGPIVYYPHNVGLATGGDTLLTELAYRICAMCCKMGNNVDFAPCLDVPRNDKNGRVYEGWGENVDVTKRFARAAVRGLQGTDLSSDYTMIATAKHYAGAGGTGNGVMRSQTNTGSWDVLCRIHLPQFHAAVAAGVASVMTAYNTFPTSSTNSTQLAMTCHKTLITDTLKNAWGFDGFVISDWMMGTDAGTGGLTQGPINAVAAGLDVAMQPSNALDFINAVKGAANGQIPMSRIDDAVRRCLRVKMRMGLFANPLPNQQLGNYFSDNVYRSVARALVRKSIVLLKNDNATLPLKTTGKIHVVGAWADNMGVQCGGWSETGGDAWQGSTTAHGIAGATTILQGLQAGIGATGRITSNAAATGIPTDADVIVVVVGETPYAEDAGYRTDITLASDQIALVHTAAASGKPVVTILLTGRPNAIGTIAGDSKALVAAWLPGTEGGGVTDVLYGGSYNFTGKLPYSWPANNNQEPVNTGSMGDAVGTDVSAPLYQYGYGLTY